MWFEFDAQQTRPMPAVFLQRCMPKGRANGALMQTFAALAFVAGEVAPDFVAASERAEANVCYVGALLSRADALYRLALPATHDNMASVLALLGWRGDARALQALLIELAPAYHSGQNYQASMSIGRAGCSTKSASMSRCRNYRGSCRGCMSVALSPRRSSPCCSRSARSATSNWFSIATS